MQTAMKMALIRRMIDPGRSARRPLRPLIRARPAPNVHEAAVPRNLEHLLW